MRVQIDGAGRDYSAERLDIRGREFRWGTRTFLMGIINATPDSFSGDGLGTDVERAASLAETMQTEGADWLDIGGESSRPGAEELDEREEARRVIPVIEAVRAKSSLPISVDTYHAAVARAALAAGADAINDIWGLRHDPAMAGAVAEAGAVLVAMHNQRGRPEARSVTAAVTAGFVETLKIAAAHGIERSRIILDPGFGFGWKPEENFEIIRELPEFRSFRLPLLLGTSRKSTIGHYLGGAGVEDRLGGTAATVALAIAGGVDIVRVHDVGAMAKVARVADAVVGRGPMVDQRVRVVLALGSNLGDRLGNLRAAVELLAAAGITTTARSCVWETPPVPPDQPRFLNAVIVCETRQQPNQLLALLKATEHALGRRPERRWGPRPLDVDILFYGEQRVETAELRIPHPLLLTRSFVLAPLAEVLPGPLPVLQTTAAETLKDIGTEGLKRVSAL
jgi:dihydropteroate synthase